MIHFSGKGNHFRYKTTFKQNYSRFDNIESFRSYIVDIKSMPGISITGIGLPLLPHSSLDVKISTQVYNSAEFRLGNEELTHEGSLIPSGNKDTDIEPINFQNPIKVDNYSYYNRITIQIKGRGALRFGCRNLSPPFERNEWITNNLNYSRKNGLVKNIEVSIRTEDRGILAELYIKPLNKENL